MAASARQLRGIDGVEASVGGKHQNLRCRLGEEREVERVVGLEREAGQIGDLAAQRADPALLGNHDRDRLALDQGLLDRRLVVRRRLRKTGAAFAERRLRPECVAHLADLVGDGLPLLLFRAQQLLDRFLLRAQLFVLLADFHLFQPAQVAQPHVEDGVGLHIGKLEGLHQHRLRLVLAADDLDDLVEVEIGDQIAAEHLEPMLDLAEPVTRAAQQHLAPVRRAIRSALRPARRPWGCGPAPARSC